jgi:prophage DNA circulation protein
MLANATIESNNTQRACFKMHERVVAQHSETQRQIIQSYETAALHTNETMKAVMTSVTTTIQQKDEIYMEERLSIMRSYEESRKSNQRTIAVLFALLLYYAFLYAYQLGVATGLNAKPSLLSSVYSVYRRDSSPLHPSPTL